MMLVLYTEGGAQVLTCEMICIRNSTKGHTTTITIIVSERVGVRGITRLGKLGRFFLLKFSGHLPLLKGHIFYI